MLLETKYCWDCKLDLPATKDFFYVNRRSDGFKQQCKGCRRKAASHWYKQNLERGRSARRAYAGDHRDEAALRGRRHYEENREAYIERARIWVEEHPEQARSNNANSTRAYTARKAGVLVESVDRQVVFERDEGICGICREPVEKDDFHLDHVIPLSKGGEHSYANVQVAHPPCNLAKADRLDFAPIMQEGCG